MHPTLTLDVPDLPARFSVTFDRWDMDRAQYRWEITVPAPSGIPVVIASASDLRMPAHNANEAEALACLLDFFGAYCEAVAYERTSDRVGRFTISENSSMFPPELRPLADAIGADAIFTLRSDTFGDTD